MLLVVVSTETDTRNGFARSVGSALRISNTLVGDRKRGRADQGAVFATSRGLEGTLRLGGDTSGDISRAGAASALGGAEIACDTLHLDGLFVRFATVLWVTVVAVGSVVLDQPVFAKVESQGFVILLSGFDLFGGERKIDFSAEHLVAGTIDGSGGGGIFAVGGELADRDFEADIDSAGASGALETSVVNCPHSQGKFDGFGAAAITSVGEHWDVIQMDGHGVLATGNLLVDGALAIDRELRALHGLTGDDVNLGNFAVAAGLSAVFPGSLAGDGGSGKEGDCNRLQHFSIK